MYLRIWARLVCMTLLTVTGCGGQQVDAPAVQGPPAQDARPQSSRAPAQASEQAGQGVAWQVIAWPTLQSGSPDDIGRSIDVRVSSDVAAPWQVVLRVLDAPATIGAVAVHVQPDRLLPRQLSLHAFLGDSPVDRAFFNEFLRLSDRIGALALPDAPGWYLVEFEQPRNLHYLWFQTGGSGDPAGTDLPPIRLLTPAQVALLRRDNPDAFVTLPLTDTDDSAPATLGLPTTAPLREQSATPALDQTAP